MSKLCSLVLLAVVVAGPAFAAEEGPEVLSVSCSPLGGAWWWIGSGYAPPEGPQLAVVDTDLSPEHVRLFLDGQLVGTADDFDGYPDYMYLEPGQFRLEVRLGGYRSAVLDLVAEPGCLYTLSNSIARIPGTPKEHWWDAGNLPDPVARLYAPQRAVAASAREPASEPPKSGPDPSLRPDLQLGGPGRGAGGERPPGRGGSLRLAVEPANAAVYVDGHFVATGGELAKMVGPLAVGVGEHRLEVVAPGFVAFSVRVVIGEGGQEEVRVVLQPAAPPPG